MQSLEFFSRLETDADTVWAHAISPEGINYELGPWLRMTLPAEGLDTSTVKPGVPLGRSWLLLGGLLPVDYDDLCLAEIRPLYFREVSTLFSQKHWQHERTVLPLAQGCEVRDRLEFSPRVPGTGALSAAIVARVFRHRHARLRQRFKSAEA